MELTQQIVDYTKHHISGVDLQRNVVLSKFALWDTVIDNNLLASTNPAIRNEAILLLEDDTIYEYAFFKNEEGKPFEYEAYQDLIGQCTYRYNGRNSADPNRFVMFLASNQIGKSRFMVGKARKLLFTEKGRNIVIVTNNLKLTQFMLSEVKASLNQSSFADSWREDIGEADNTTMLTVELKIGGKTYTNRLICTPAGEGSLGFPIHYLFLDELDFYENGKRLFWKVFYPRLNKTKGQCFVFSNPNPDVAQSESILHELWEGSLFKRKYHFNFLDASWNTQEEFDTAQRNSPAHIFCSTHLGEWSEEGGAFLTSKEIKDMRKDEWSTRTLPATTEQVYIAIDLGKMRDNTVFTVGTIKQPLDTRDKYMDLDVLYHEAVKLGTTYEAVVDRYKQIKEYYEEQYSGVAEMGYDATGQKTFEDLLKIKGVQGTPVDFAKKESNKTLLYNDFKLMAENRKIKIAYGEQCFRQLAGLQFKYTQNKKLQKVEAKTESIHDDYCFVKGTKILTDKGQVNIEELKKGDFVLTRKGWKKIINTGSRVDEVITKLGLTGTPDHPFITNKGVVKFKYLNESHQVYIWNEKQSSMEVKPIIAILNHQGDNIGYTTGVMTNGKNHQKRYTEKSGKTIMDQFQKDGSSTTKTETQQTTQSPTSTACQEENTNQYTQTQKNKNNKQEKTLTNTLDQKRKNGTVQKKESNGTKNIITTHSEKVYNITVEGAHEYFANNILVHNCDSLAILIHIAVKPSRVKPTAQIINTKKQEDKEDKQPETTHDSAKEYMAKTIRQHNSMNKTPNSGGGEMIW